MPVHIYPESYQDSCETPVMPGEAFFHQDHDVVLPNHLYYQQLVDESP